MKKSGVVQIPFAWLFAIIVGMAVLAIAIFAVTKIVDTGETQVDAKMGREIGVLLNPLETGFESLRASSFTMPVKTRIYGGCNNNGYFGRQIIQVSQQSFNKWTETDIDVGFSNKYIFAEKPVEGKKFYIFSKPFDFPFKVASLIYLTSAEEKYCFTNAPEEILDELETTNQENFRFGEECLGTETNVCFETGSDCDVLVKIGQGYVQKQSDTVYFESEALMYAAIFSDPEVYECQLKRLMQRVVSLVEIYKDKAELTSRSGCNFDLERDLTLLGNQARNIIEKDSSINLDSSTIANAELIGTKNDLMSCKLW